MSTIKAVVSDFDGVLRAFPGDKRAALEKKLGLPEGTFLNALFITRRYSEAVLGKVTDEEWRIRASEDIGKEFGEECAKAALVDYQNGFPGIVVEEVLSIYKALAPGIELHLMTNATSRLARDLEMLDLRKYFDRVFNSSEFGIAKPDAAAFRHVLDSVSLGPEELLFIDDTQANVDAAESLGIQSHLFISSGELYKFLAEKGVLRNSHA
jgi:putative hydrolase of the HAD superfamily